MNVEQAYANLALSENGFLFDALTGNTFSLNKTGKLILQGLIKGESRDQLTADIIDRFEITEDIAHKDIQQFIHHLKEMGVIPK
ncbi:MAG: PqqD family protein [bacterium]|nr:PqqD family protein [bacterium]